MPCDCGAYDCKSCGPLQGYGNDCERCGCKDYDCECEEETPEQIEAREVKRVIQIGMFLWGDEI